MTESATASALQELVALGLVASQPAPRALSGGNADRRDRSSRTSWRVNLPDGRPVRLILGGDLSTLAKNQAAFTHACPELVPSPVFHQKLSAGEAFAESFIAGDDMESAAQESPERVRADFTRTCALLATTARKSTEAERLAEWQCWTRSTEALPVWTPEEKMLLQTRVWPALYPLLTSTPPIARWTNGDFTSGNILLDQAGHPHLIDHEFAHETHFFTEDLARFHCLSPAARQQPELFSSTPVPGPAWHLFFWLRQLGLETAHNTASYLERMRPARLAIIRRLAETVLDCQLSGWSVAATPLHHSVEFARWEQTIETAIRVSGWCHVPGSTLRAILVSQGDQVLTDGVPTRRLDVLDHFDSAPGAYYSGFSLAIPLREPETRLVVSALTDTGEVLPFHSFLANRLPGRGPWVEDYTRWAELYDRDPIEPTLASPGPLFSVLVPVYNTPIPFLRACLESVRHQHYREWELCIVDDASTDGNVAEYLRQFAQTDPRIRLQTLKVNGGISRASNAALASASGSFVVMLDHDDLLRPHALLEFARYLADNPETDAVYSDEDKLSPDGRRIAPSFKPDFSPEHLLGVMYVGHALCVRTTVARDCGGFDPVYDGMQDYEFFLRVTEHTRRIGHVPRILYHWRQSPGSSSLHGNIKGNIDEKQAAAVRAHLKRQGRTEYVQTCHHHRLQLYATEEPTVEVVRLSPGDDFIARLVRVASASDADVLLVNMLDSYRANGHWVQDLATLALRPDSGLVAPLLLSPEGLVHESGWTIGTAGTAPIMRGFDPAGDGSTGSLLCTREVSAVSPACFAVKRKLLLTPSPADENWLGLCLRLHRSKSFHRVCSTARVQLSSAQVLPSVETNGTAPGQDPYFNPHYDPLRADYSLARPPAHLHAVLWHLDNPPASRLANGRLHLRGWCFSSAGKEIKAVRLRAGSLILFGVVGLPRPDVKAALPEAPDDNTGFEIRGKLPPGHNALCVEAGQADGTWALLMTHAVEVEHPRRPVWLGHGNGHELMNHQLPTYAAHAPQTLRPEIFPARSKPSHLRLAIVTPSYQQARFLLQTMRSVLDQPEVQCDYFVQDGGSTDGSVEIIKELASSPNPPRPLVPPQPRLAAWQSARDRGQTEAIARGFAQTSGGPDDLMAWINSDDFYLPGALAYVADYFSRHPAVDVLYGHRIIVNDESQEVGRWVLPRHSDAVLQLNDYVPQETMFWRRRIWDKVGGLDLSFQFAMDWDLLLRFQAAGAKIVRVPYFLACFRIHPQQKTSAAIHNVGQREIDLLRARANGRTMQPAELESHPQLIRYLRRSDFYDSMWRLGIRLP